MDASILMRALCFAALAGCFTAPDYAGTRFKCDVEPVCPDGFTCFEGVCRDDVAPDGMVMFPAGVFKMGCFQSTTDCMTDAQFPHDVVLSEFAIDKYEVTEAQYRMCAETGGCSTDTAPNAGSQNLPVRGVKWEDARTYCDFVGKQLPTEAQWERAARASESQTFPWVGGFACALANAGPCGYGGVVDIHTFLEGATKEGLMHMSGNVREWVADSYDETFYLGGDASDPVNATVSPLKVVRGGSFRTPVAFLKVWYRDKADQNNGGTTYDDLGFRCAK